MKNVAKIESSVEDKLLTQAARFVTHAKRMGLRGPAGEFLNKSQALNLLAWTAGYSSYAKQLKSLGMPNAVEQVAPSMEITPAMEAAPKIANIAAKKKVKPDYFSMNGPIAQALLDCGVWFLTKPSGYVGWECGFIPKAKRISYYAKKEMMLTNAAHEVVRYAVFGGLVDQALRSNAKPSSIVIKLKEVAEALRKRNNISRQGGVNEAAVPKTSSITEVEALPVKSPAVNHNKRGLMLKKELNDSNHPAFPRKAYYAEVASMTKAPKYWAWVSMKIDENGGIDHYCSHCGSYNSNSATLQRKGCKVCGQLS